MNEHEPHGPSEPERINPPGKVPESAPPQTETPESFDTLDPTMLSDALDLLRRYKESANGYGEAFLAYLELDIPEPVAGSEINDFLDRYLGHFETRRDFLANRIKDLGWAVALRDFKTELGMWDNDLHWNEAALWDHFCRTYGVVERFGGVHAFRR